MSQQQVRRKFRALQIVSLIYKGLAILAATVAAVIVVGATLSVLFDSRTSNILAAFGAIPFYGLYVAPLLIAAFIAFVISEVIGLFLSMHDHLQTLRNLQVQSNQALLEELKRTNGLLQVQFKRTTAILEQHHRRVAHLEEERNT